MNVFVSWFLTAQLLCTNPYNRKNKNHGRGVLPPLGSLAGAVVRVQDSEATVCRLCSWHSINPAARFQMQPPARYPTITSEAGTGIVMVVWNQTPKLFTSRGEIKSRPPLEIYLTSLGEPAGGPPLAAAPAGIAMPWYRTQVLCWKREGGVGTV